VKEVLFYSLSIHGHTSLDHIPDDLHDTAFREKELFRAQSLQSVVEAKPLHFRPIIVTLINPYVPCVDKISIPSLWHGCKNNKKSSERGIKNEAFSWGCLIFSSIFKRHSTNGRKMALSCAKLRPHPFG
jgi:hypothetical protein